MSALLTSTSFAFTVTPYPAPTSKLTVPATPPPLKPAPAVTPVTVPPIVFTSTNESAPAPSVANT